MKAKTGFDYVMAYLLWFVTLCLGAWFVFISRNTFETFLGGYYIKEKGQFLLSQQARFLDIVFPVVLWLLWLVMMIVTEEYYRKGAQKGNVLKRFAKVAGVLLVLIFIADLCQNLMLGLTVVGWLRWLLTIFELLAGVALIFAGRLKPASPDAKPGTGAAS